MKSIDFLPHEYREKYAVRYQRLWRLLVLLVFGGTVGAATGVQVWVNRGIEKRLEETEPKYRVALEQSRRLGALYRQIDQHKDRAALVALLERQWPLSRLASGCFRPVDPSIALESWRLSRKTETRPRSNTPRRRRTASRSTQAESTPAARADLHQLYDELKKTRFQIELVGAARSLPSLYRYLGTLSTHPLFDHVELTRLESEERPDRPALVHFQIEIAVRSTTEPLKDRSKEGDTGETVDTAARRPADEATLARKD